MNISPQVEAWWVDKEFLVCLCRFPQCSEALTSAGIEYRGVHVPGRRLASRSRRAVFTISVAFSCMDCRDYHGGASIGDVL